MAKPPNAGVQSAPQPSIPASAMPLISPNALLLAHLKQTPPRRPSGRVPLEARTAHLNVGSLSHCNGSSLVKVGSTTIVCGVRAQILPVTEIPTFRVKKSSQSYGNAAAVRTKDRGGEADSDLMYSPITLYNLLVPNIELATGCSPRHAATLMPSDEAQSLSQRLLSLLHSSKLVRPSDLEIIYDPPEESRDPELGIDNDRQTKAYWTLYIDLMCLSHGGSIFDAAWLAIYAALRDTELPKSWWDADLEQVLCSSQERNFLQLHGQPVPCSFGVFVPESRLVSNDVGIEQPYWILADPDAFEEESCPEACCITLGTDDQSGQVSILRIEKSGGAILDVGLIEDMYTIAKERALQWNHLLDGVFTRR